jgi:alpha-1,2-mannosyltransferase
MLPRPVLPGERFGGTLPVRIASGPVSLRSARLTAGLLVLAAVVTAVVLDVRHPDVLLRLIPSTDMYELHVDFDTFWQSAVALTHGADIYDTPAKLRNLNPPLLTVLLTPFAPLDPVTAYRIWVALTTLMVAGSVLAVARELRLRVGVTVAALLAVLASSPLHGTLVLGQIYPLLLVGLVAGWIAERRGRPVLAAVLFGVTVALKPSLAPLLLLAAVQRRWVPFRAGIAAAAVATLAGVLAAGPSSALGWLRIAFTEVTPDTVDNASMPGLAVRLGLPSAFGLAAGLVVMVGTLAWCGRHRDRTEGSLAGPRTGIDPGGTVAWAVIAAGLLLSPIAWHNYLMLLFPGALVLIALGRGTAAAVMLAVAVIPVSWNADWPAEGVGQGVARSLYFAILLGYWVVLLRSALLPVPPSASGATDEEPDPVGSTAGSDAA